MFFGKNNRSKQQSIELQSAQHFGHCIRLSHNRMRLPLEARFGTGVAKIQAHVTFCIHVRCGRKNEAYSS
jgi:hypothetical protein